MQKTMMTLLLTSLWTLSALAGEPKLLKVDLKIQQEGEPTTIQLSFPLTMIGSMAPQITEAIEDIHTEGNNSVDIRQLWKEIRAAGPNEFVNVQGHEGNIKVSTDETTVTISFDSTEEGNVLVKVPLELGDLLLGGDTVTTVESVIASLESWQGDLITITGTKANGHIWIE